MKLQKAYIADLGMGKQVAYGEIFEDEKARFVNGTFVRTSLIQKSWTDEESGKKFIQTKNSLYEIEEIAEENGNGRRH